jgi:hypothetical protein
MLGGNELGSPISVVSDDALMSADDVNSASRAPVDDRLERSDPRKGKPRSSKRWPHGFERCKGPCGEGRALHVKQHAGVRAALHTFADLPAWKFSLVPLSAPDGAEVPKSDPDRLRVDLAARLAKAPIECELRVQPFVSAEKTPIKNPTKEWDAHRLLHTQNMMSEWTTGREYAKKT